MSDHAGITESIWMGSATVPKFVPLTKDHLAHVCIVGAGISGLSAAYNLAREGLRVAVIDDGPIGGGETERTTAHLTTAADDRYFVLERLHGEEGARLAAESYAAAIARIESIIAFERLECDFARVDGYLLRPEDVEKQLLERELEASRRAGVFGVNILPAAPLIGFQSGPCLHFPQQAQFHPMKYLAGLASAIERLGGSIFTHTHALRIRGGSDAHVQTSAGPIIRAEHIIVATNTPVNDLVAIHTKQAAYRTYAIAARVASGTVGRALFWDGYWDNHSPYHYVRLQEGADGHDVLIVGGEDHKTGQGGLNQLDIQQRYDRLAEWARRRFGPLQGIVKHWSGQVMESIDGLAFIGRNPLDSDNVYVATGDSGMGMVHGTLAGMILMDLILGRENRWASLYDPSRRTLKAAGDFMRENANVAAQYGEWLTAGEVESIDDIKAGCGGVVRRGLHKVAVYRDERGIVHERSAVCPHLGCFVHWNAGEKSWDCPCHGSRFDALGHVLNGPAIVDLHPVKQRRPAEAARQAGADADAARSDESSQERRPAIDDSDQPSLRQTADHDREWRE